MTSSAANDQMSLSEAEDADRERALDDIALLMWRFDISVAEVEAYCAKLNPGRAPRVGKRPIKAFVPYFGD